MRERVREADRHFEASVQEARQARERVDKAQEALQMYEAGVEEGDAPDPKREATLVTALEEAKRGMTQRLHQRPNRSPVASLYWVDERLEARADRARVALEFARGELQTFANDNMDGLAAERAPQAVEMARREREAFEALLAAYSESKTESSWWGRLVRDAGRGELGKWTASPSAALGTEVPPLSEFVPVPDALAPDDVD